jgi:large subunit ribosomal protein L24
MRTKFSLSWLGSKQPRKQRKFRFNAPLHIRRKFLSVHLSKELRAKYGCRSMPVIVGDKVKLVRGQFKGTMSDVETVNLKKTRIYVKGAEHKKSEGRTSPYPIHPSNAIIITLKMDDAMRKKSIERKGGKK